MTPFRESGYAGAVGRWGSSGEGGGGGGEEGFEGRTAAEYDHGNDAEVFYLGLALDPAYVEGFVEGCLERIGEDDYGKDVLRASGKTATPGSSPWRPSRAGWKFGLADLRVSCPSL